MDTQEEAQAQIEPRPEMLYHKVTDIGDIERMGYIREQYYKLYGMIKLNTPTGRSQALAITHLEDSLMRAIQAIAIEFGEPQPLGL
jgi:hypothetical protein